MTSAAAQQSDDDVNYDELMAQHIGTPKKFASIEKTQERIQAERKAGRTAKQRERDKARKPAKILRAYRFHQETLDLLKPLGKKLSIKTDTEVLERAIAEMADRYGVK